MPYHVRVQQPGRSDLFAFDLDAEDLRARVVDPWRRGQSLRIEGAAARLDSETRITISRTETPASKITDAAGSPRAGTHAAALAVVSAGTDVTNDYLRGSPGSAGDSSATQQPHEVVIQICRKFPEVAHALAERQRGREPLEVNDEYDVQYLLMAVLRLFFADVRPEEPLPSHGERRPRVDFLLAEENIIVECKMTRADLGGTKIQRELAEDFEHYRSRPTCRYVIVLIYDPKRLLRSAAQMQKDLSSDHGTFETFVIIAR